MNWLLIILIILIIIIYILDEGRARISEGFENMDETNGYAYTNHKNMKSNQMRNMLYIFHRLCDEQGIYYIIAYGTLLGAVRHWGMIPWDDDVDIIVYNKDRAKIYQIMNTMRDEYGYSIDNLDKLSRVLCNKGDKNYFMDIFFVEDINGEVVRTFTLDYGKIQDKYKEEYLEKDVPTNAWWWNGFGYDCKLMKERKKYIYDDMYLWGPKNARPVLEAWYGKDFLTVNKTHYLKDHETYVPQKVIHYRNNLKPQL
jgi:hypothetical protein